MNPVALIRQTLIWLRYRNAAFVNSREELDAALRRAPARIVVDGDEALRAHAASLAALHQPGPAPRRPVPESAALLAVPPVGRITDGHRRRHRKREAPFARRDGLALPLLVLCGTLAALVAEALASLGWPAGDMRMLSHGKAMAALAPVTSAMWLDRAGALVLALSAALCFARAAWSILRLGTPLQTEWRVEYRVPGRLVMVRARRRAAP